MIDGANATAATFMFPILITAIPAVIGDSRWVGDIITAAITIAVTAFRTAIRFASAGRVRLAGVDHAPLVQ